MCVFHLDQNPADVEKLLHISMESRCSLYIENDNRVPNLRYENLKTQHMSSRCLKMGRESKYLRLVLNLHLATSKQLGIYPLRQPGENILPRRPNTQPKLEAPRDRENRIPNNVPQERIQEEQHQIHHIHDSQSERRPDSYKARLRTTYRCNSERPFEP